MIGEHGMLHPRVEVIYKCKRGFISPVSFSACRSSALDGVGAVFCLSPAESLL